MTLEPSGPDNSAEDDLIQPYATDAEQVAATTDANGMVIDTTSDSAAATDAYGYQSISADNNYNPNVAADGTNLSTALAQARRDTGGGARQDSRSAGVISGGSSP